LTCQSCVGCQFWSVLGRRFKIGGATGDKLGDNGRVERRQKPAPKHRRRARPAGRTERPELSKRTNRSAERRSKAVEDLHCCVGGPPLRCDNLPSPRHHHTARNTAILDKAEILTAPAHDSLPPFLDVRAEYGVEVSSLLLLRREVCPKAKGSWKHKRDGKRISQHCPATYACGWPIVK
jgi:hypothetical protein